MNVFQSLYTPGALVRTPSDRHARITSFDMTSNLATVQFSDGGDDEEVHVTKLRAGNDASELAFRGRVTSLFPKVFPLELSDPGQARRVRPVDWRDLTANR